MNKIGFVTSWYGDNISGGAEAELRGLVKHLQASGVELEILTTCVKDFNSDWNTDYYPEGLSTDGGISVRRFKVRKRDTKSFDAVNLKLMKGIKITPAEEEIYMQEMVNSERLIEYIKVHQEEYALFVGIPYMFGPVFQTALTVPEKFVMIPCFHDEAYFYMDVFKEAYSRIAGLIYNAKPEYTLANRVYKLSQVKQIVTGLGLDANISGNASRFIEKYHITNPFILYAGRKDAGKNVDMLLKYFVAYKKNHSDSDLQLVLIGGGKIDIPRSVKNDVHDLGFVDIQDKYDAYSAATVLCQPSTHESFSIVIMESWLCHRPVLVHGKCEVTKNFAIESNGGLWFNDYYEFDEAVSYMVTHEAECKILAENGRKYVLANFSWDVIVEEMTRYFEEVVNSDKKSHVNEGDVITENITLDDDINKIKRPKKLTGVQSKSTSFSNNHYENNTVEVHRHKRICFVVQRYGMEVNGGAELHCRQLAEHLKSKYDDITVLTSKAIDYITWRNEYKSDEEDINGVHVIRFPVVHERDQNEFNTINARFLYGGVPFTEEEEREWVDKQGPAIPSLIEYLRDNKDNYDVFIFFTYLYYQTMLGVVEVADKAIVIPTAHDEPWLRMRLAHRMFNSPRFFFYNTEEERQMVHSRFHNERIPSDLGGTGVDLPKVIDGNRFREKYKNKGLGEGKHFLLYIGRIDEGKNCDVLFQYFKEYKKHCHRDLKLVLMGKAVIPIPKDRDIVSLGFVSDQDKFDGIKAADIFVLPSRNESLSMVVLESMSVGTPVMVNGACNVLKSHCLKSNGALWFTNCQEFEKVIDFYEDIENTDKIKRMVQNSKKYVDENYQWNKIINKLSVLIERV